MNTTEYDNDNNSNNSTASFGGPDYGAQQQIYEVRPEPIIPPGVAGYGATDFRSPIAPAGAPVPTYAPVAPVSMQPQSPRRRGSVMYFLLGLLIFAVAVTTVAIGSSAAGLLLAASPFIVIGSIVVLFTMRR